MSGRFFCFGLGYSARALTRRHSGEAWNVAGTSRTGEPGTKVFNRAQPLAADVLAGATHVLVSVPPDEKGDPVLDCHGRNIAALPALRWLGYLSTTGVYGDRGGAWVDEKSAPAPTGARGRRRLAAERGWLELHRRHGVPIHVFRLAAIYGPARSPFAALEAGAAKRIDKPGQVFSRIHVEDLVSVLCASMTQPRPGAVYNVCDDDPAPPETVTAHAAALLGMPPPPLLPLEAAGLSPMARSFYDDNKRVSNRLIKVELGVTLRYPDYRTGLAAILAEEGLPKPPGSGKVRS